MPINALVINVDASLDVGLHLHLNLKNIILLQHLPLHPYLLLLLGGAASNIYFGLVVGGAALLEHHAVFWICCIFLLVCGTVLLVVHRHVDYF